jgi:dephospho-CoA kinase
MLRVGLTGGIAVGKSYVVSVLRELGAEINDADSIAHEVMEPGKPAYQEIICEFGQDVPELLNADQTINRQRLGAFVFSHSERLKRLNEIIHPRVFAAQDEWMQSVARRNPQVIVVIDAALMIETGSYKRFDKIVVVHCDAEIQLARLMQRNQLSREAAAARITSQMPSAEKLRYADYSIDTSAGFTETRQQTVRVWNRLCEDLRQKASILEK